MEDAAPLSRPSVSAKVGEYLIAINQLRLTLSIPPEVALRRLAGKEVYLTLAASKGSGGGGGGWRWERW